MPLNYAGIRSISMIAFPVGMALVCFGCNPTPQGEPPVRTAPAVETAAGNSANTPQDNVEPVQPVSTVGSKTAGSKNAPSDAPPSKSPANASDGKPSELTVGPITVMVPGAWTRVDPPTIRILDAEYTVPKSAGDEFDGRATMMAAGGELDANIGRWTSEFQLAEGVRPEVEKVKIGGVEATIVDITGTWKGSSFAPIPPRDNYRLLAAVIPLSERSAFFIKFIGPRSTVADHAAEWRECVTTSRLKPGTAPAAAP